MLGSTEHAYRLGVTADWRYGPLPGCETVLGAC